MNILFVCKHNRFRSRVAESYFNKINNNKNIHARSAGIIKGTYPLSKNQVLVAKQLGININGKPQSLTAELLIKTNLIIIVADDVPKRVFNPNGYYKGKIVIWRIKDVYDTERKDLIEKTIRSIMKKVDRFVERMKKEK
jgi:protein-tyrosine-phosphatase